MKQEKGNWKPYNVKYILRNVELVFKSKDSKKLNKVGYGFLYLMSGFIAHYDLHGFQYYYRDLRLLINDLNPESLRNDAYRDETDRDFNEWYGKSYNKSKADVKRGLADLSEKYADEIDRYFSLKESGKEIAKAKKDCR